jgi:hypothetical protein
MGKGRKKESGVRSQETALPANPRIHAGELDYEAVRRWFEQINFRGEAFHPPAVMRQARSNASTGYRSIAQWLATQARRLAQWAEAFSHA